MADIILTKEDMHFEDELFDFIRTLNQNEQEKFQIFIQGFKLGKQCI